MRLLAAVGVLAIVAALGSTLYFFGGFYDVAAVAPDHAVVASIVTAVREASVDRRASSGAAPALDEAAAVKAGARAFVKDGCVECHGAPGVDPSPFTKGMNPPPPDLKEAGEEDDPRQIFWVARNGIKMTGMPGFAAANVGDQELWQIVAYVKKLPTLSAEEFGAWRADAGN